MANTYLSQVSPLPLISLFAVTIVVAYLIAWFYRKEYEPLKSVKVYLLYALPFLILGLVLQVKVSLMIGTYLFGSIVLIFRNQHYFDQ